MFTELFKKIDNGTHSILNESQFRRLLNEMRLIDNQEEINYLVGKIDPFYLNSMTYSDIV